MPATETSERPPEERYQILGRIAVGGMAEIYLAMDSVLQREIVLKRLMPGLQADAEFVRMFYDEANIAARLSHPNIVTIHQLGELDGSLFIAMELLHGVNLRELQVSLEESGRAIPLGLGLRITIDALAALDYAHRFTDQYDRSLRVVHRDVSPQNIIVTYTGDTKLVDFGVAKAEGRLHQTRAGLIKGKFAYMSPEQISGAPLDGRSDLFALGEVLYELLLKRHPFYAPVEMEMLRAVIDEAPQHPRTVDPDFPGRLANIVLRALQKQPEDRYGTAGLMRKDLEQFAADNAISLNNELLSRFMHDLYKDRLTRLETARRDGDWEQVVANMRVVDGAPAARPVANAPMIAPDEPSTYASPPAGRRQTVGVGANDSERSVAHSNATIPARAQRYDKSDVFDAPPVPDATVRNLSPPVQGQDDADLPTVMGELSAEEMERLRAVAAQARAETSDDPSPTIVPDPAERATLPRGNGQAPPTKPVAEARRAITPRSQTVPGDKPADDGGSQSGLAFFVAGLVAFVGAIAYAIYLFWGARPS